MKNDQLNRDTATPLNPAEIAHVRRVAAWCAGLAGKLNLPAAERKVLENAAWLHQQSKLIAGEESWAAFRLEMGIGPARSGEPNVHDPAMEVIQALHGNRPGSEGIRSLARILEQCDDLDTACELDATVSAEQELNGLEGIVSAVAGYFTGVTDRDLDSAASTLPVFSVIAFKAITMLGNENTNLNDLESLISSDQTLAGHIIGAANSVAMGSAVRVKSIRQAVVRIGMEFSRQIVSAASLRRLFESKESQELWNHSLEVAESAANIARRSSLVDPEEAFLAGLMHDVGKLVILNLPAAALPLQAQLVESGCPDTVVERTLIGHDHASIGARVLRNWRFSESLSAAVAHHHTPELNSSPLCSVLYLAEISSQADQAIKSDWREEMARKNLWLRGDDCRAPGANSLVATLRFGAGG